MVEVSSEFSGSLAGEQAIDGETGTEWATAGDGDDGTITVDLGAGHQIAGIEFVTRSMADGSAIGAQIRHIDAEESLPPDLRRDYLDLADWIHDLGERHGDRVAVRVIDAASLVGVWTSLRHRARSYPAVRVDSGRWIKEDYRALGPVIDQMLADTKRPGSARPSI